MRRPTEDVKRMEINPVYYTMRWMGTVFRWFYLICTAFLILYPLLYMLSVSVRSKGDFLDVTVIWLPKSPTLEHFKTAIFDIKLLDAMKNTAIISVGSTALQIFIAALTGYGFARYRSKGKNILFAFVILSIVVPSQMLSLPNYLLFSKPDFFGLIGLITGGDSLIPSFLDSFSAFFLPALLGQGMRSGIFILVFRQFFSGLPVELEEAALIDGCGHSKTFFYVMLPNAKTPIVVYSLFSLVWYWSDYFTSSIYLANIKTLSVRLDDLRGFLEIILPREQLTSWYIVPIEMAACLLSILPLLIIFIIGQRWFVQGIDRTGIVG